MIVLYLYPTTSVHCVKAIYKSSQDWSVCTVCLSVWPLQCAFNMGQRYLACMISSWSKLCRVMSPCICGLVFFDNFIVKVFILGRPLSKMYFPNYRYHRPVALHCWCSRSKFHSLTATCFHYLSLSICIIPLPLPLPPAPFDIAVSSHRSSFQRSKVGITLTLAHFNILYFILTNS